MTPRRILQLLIFAVCAVECVKSSCSICECKRTLVNCSGRGLTEIPKLKQTVETIDLSRNNITNLHNDSFQRYKQAKNIILRHNFLTSVNDYAFRNLPNLQTIYLAGNPIKCDCPTKRFKSFVETSSTILESEVKDCRDEMREFCPPLNCSQGISNICEGVLYGYCQTKYEITGNNIIKTKSCAASCVNQCTRSETASRAGPVRMTCYRCCSTPMCNQAKDDREFRKRLRIEFSIPFLDYQSGDIKTLLERYLAIANQHARAKFKEIEPFGVLQTMKELQPDKVNGKSFIRGYFIWGVVKFNHLSQLKNIVRRVESAMRKDSMLSNHTLKIQNNCMDIKGNENRGTLSWPLIWPNDTAHVPCLGKPWENASRSCRINGDTGLAAWGKPDLSNCTARPGSPSREASRAEIELEIKKGKTDIAARKLLNYTKKYVSASDDEQISETLNMLTSIVNKSEVIETDVATSLTGVISSLLSLDVNGITTYTAQRFVDTVEKFLNSLGETDTPTGTINDEFVSFSSLKIARAKGSHLLLAGNTTSSKAGGSDSVTAANDAFSIKVPKSASVSSTFLRFAFFERNVYFEAAQKEKLPKNKRVAQQVLSASFDKEEVRNLSDPVQIRFPSLIVNGTKRKSGNVTCVFWDKTARKWSSVGCVTRRESDGSVTCECNHLTNFALLMDVYNIGEVQHLSYVFTILSLGGCALSVIGLLLTIITHLHFRQLHKEMPGKILTCLCMTLLSVNIVFLSGSWYKTDDWGCKVIAMLFHYLYLSVMLWSSVEAVYLYLALVKVLGSYVSRFMVKAGLFAWGVPLIPVGITIAISRENYGLISDSICFIKYFPFLGGFAIPVGALVIANGTIFIIVMVKMQKSMQRTKYETAKHSNKRISRIAQIRGSLGLCILLGLTWIFGFFGVDEISATVFQTLFVIFNTLQGVFIFLVYCIFKKEALLAWSKYIPGCQKLSDHLNSSISQSKSSNGQQSNSQTIQKTISSSATSLNSHTTSRIELVPRTFKLEEY